MNEMEKIISEKMDPEFLEGFEPIEFADIDSKYLHFGTPPDTDLSRVAYYIKDFTEYPDDWGYFVVELMDNEAIEKGYYVHDGNHRLESIQLAKKQWSVPCIIVRDIR